MVPMMTQTTGAAAMAERMVAAQERFLAFAMETAGLTREQACFAYVALRKGGKRAPLKIDAVLGQFSFSHGAFAEPAVLRRAAGIE